MENIFFEGPVLWSQIDANRHMRHSAYADFAAQARLAMLEKLDLNISLFETLMVGPILFREELQYLREVPLNDRVSVSCELLRCRADGSRWSMLQEIFRGDGVKAAIVIVDGAWIDLAKRKLTVLPAGINEQFMKTPRSKDFVMEEPKQNKIINSTNMDLQAQFAAAQADSKNLSTRPDNDVLLQLYSSYKQATEGDAPAEGPSNMFDFVGKAKHEAWAKLKRTSTENAMQQYIDLVQKLKR